MLKSKALLETLHALAERWLGRPSQQSNSAVLCVVCMRVSPPGVDQAASERAAGFYFGSYYARLLASSDAEAFRAHMLCPEHRGTVDRAAREAASDKKWYEG